MPDDTREVELQIPMLHRKHQKEEIEDLEGDEGFLSAKSLSMFNMTIGSTYSMAQVEELENKDFKPPDGGYGWVIVFAAFYNQFIVGGIANMSILYSIILEPVFKKSKAETALISSICLGVTFGAGPIASMLCNKIGHQKTIVLGAILLTIGIFSSAFATSINVIFITFGIITGLGNSMIYGPSVVFVSFYFKNYRPAAIAFTLFGYSFGNLIFTFLVTLHHAYGWRCVFIIISMLTSQCIICGALMRPLDIMNDLKKPSGLLNLELLKDTKFYAFFIAEVAWNWASTSLWVTFPTYATELGYSDGAPLVLAMVGIAGTVARFAYPLLGNCIHILYLFIAGTIVMLLPMLYISFITQYYELIIASSIYGLSYGMQISTQSLVITDMFGIERLTSAIGLTLLADGLGCLIGPPFAGAVFDATKDYLYSSLTYTSVGLVAVIVYLVFVIHKVKKDCSSKVKNKA